MTWWSVSKATRTPAVDEREASAFSNQQAAGIGAGNDERWSLVYDRSIIAERRRVHCLKFLLTHKIAITHSQCGWTHCRAAALYCNVIASHCCRYVCMCAYRHKLAYMYACRRKLMCVLIYVCMYDCSSCAPVLWRQWQQSMGGRVHNRNENTHPYLCCCPRKQLQLPENPSTIIMLITSILSDSA